MTSNKTTTIRSVLLFIITMVMLTESVCAHIPKDRYASPIGKSAGERYASPFDRSKEKPFQEYQSTELEHIVNRQTDDLENTVLRSRLAEDTPCPNCITGTIQSNGICDVCGYNSDTDYKPLTVAETPLGDGFWLLAFCGLSYAGFIFLHRQEKRHLSKMTTTESN